MTSMTLRKPFSNQFDQHMHFTIKYLLNSKCIFQQVNPNKLNLRPKENPKESKRTRLNDQQHKE